MECLVTTKEYALLKGVNLKTLQNKLAKGCLKEADVHSYRKVGRTWQITLNPALTFKLEIVNRILWVDRVIDNLTSVKKEYDVLFALKKGSEWINKDVIKKELSHLKMFQKVQKDILSSRKGIALKGKMESRKMFFDNILAFLLEYPLESIKTSEKHGSVYARVMLESPEETCRFIQGLNSISKCDILSDKVFSKGTLTVRFSDHLPSHLKILVGESREGEPVPVLVDRKSQMKGRISLNVWYPDSERKYKITLL